MDLDRTLLFVEEFIDKYAQVDDRWRGIGGQVDILVLRQEIYWHKHKPDSDSSMRSGELATLFQSGAPGFKVFDGYTKEEMLDALRHL